MEYISLNSFQYYADTAPLVQSLGYELVELRVAPQKTQYKVMAVIAKKSGSADSEGIGVADCAKVHRLIEPRLEALIGSPDLYMEVTSPGMERTIRNAAEFCLFIQKMVRVWDRECSDWVSGTIVSADDKSITLDIVNGERTTIPYDRIAKAKLLNS